MTCNLNAAFRHRPIYIRGEATTTLNPEPRTLNPETPNLELSIVFLFPAVYNSYMITIL